VGVIRINGDPARPYQSLVEFSEIVGNNGQQTLHFGNMMAAGKVCCCTCSNELLWIRAVFPSPPRWKIDQAGRGQE